MADANNYQLITAAAAVARISRTVVRTRLYPNLNRQIYEKKINKEIAAINNDLGKYCI